MPRKNAKRTPEPVQGRARNIDLILPGLNWLQGANPSRFQVSSETKDPAEYVLRKAMIQDLAKRLMFDVLRARLDGQFSTTELYQAYRQGDVELKALLEQSRDVQLRPLLSRYLKESPALNPARYAFPLRRLLDYLGTDPRVSALTPKNVDAFLDGLVPMHARSKVPLSKPMKPGTVNRYRAAVSAFANWLVREGVIAKNPVGNKAVKRRPDPTRRLPDMTPAQYQAYFAEIRRRRPDRVLVFKLLIHSGADVSELIGGRALPRRPAHPGILVRDCHLSRELPRLRFQRTKTMTRVRLVPIPREVADSLVAHIQALGLGEDDTLFQGVTWSELDNIHKHAKRAAGKPGLTMKDLRHLAAIFWRRQGADLPTIRDRLGHVKIEQTVIYADYGPDDDREAAAVEAAFRALTAVSPT